MHFLLINVAAGLALVAACNSSTSPGGAVGSVTVGDLFFQSAHNGSQNPAVDTVMAGATVTWTWSESGTQHSVQSTGSPSFT